MWIKSQDGEIVNLGAAKSLRVVELSGGMANVSAGFAIEAAFPPSVPVRIVTCTQREAAEVLLEVLLSNLGYVGEMKRTIPMSESQLAEWTAAGKPLNTLREIIGLPMQGIDGDMVVPVDGGVDLVDPAGDASVDGGGVDGGTDWSDEVLMFPKHAEAQ